MPSSLAPPSPSDHRPLNPRAMRAAYVAALAIIALIIGAGQILMQHRLALQEYDARVINLAGRQRMLLLAIGQEALLSTRAERSDQSFDPARLAGHLNQWRRVQGGLRQGDSELGLNALNSPRALELLGRLAGPQEEVLAAGGRLLAGRAAGLAPEALLAVAHQVLAHGREFLPLMDDLVGLYEREASQRVRDLRRLEWLAAGLELLGLVLVGALILRPLTRRVGRDMRELAATAEAMEELSLTDALTGLANRRSLDRRLREEWRLAARQDQELALLLLDVDHFKQYNDAHGHQEGDRALREVGQVLALAARRPGDLAARYGGEELCLLLFGASLADALGLAEGVRAQVEALALPRGRPGQGGGLTASLGVASARPRQGGSPEGLLRAADQAMYQAKGQGRNRVVPAGPLDSGASGGNN